MRASPPPALAATPTRRTRAGFALVGALWLLVVLSTLALEFSIAARDHRSAAINAIDASRAEAAAEAGIDHARASLEAILRMSGRESPLLDVADPWRISPGYLSDTVSLGVSRYSISLRDAGAAVNVNRASEDELRRLFVALRMDAGQADRLAQRIADWRDADDLHRARGAEREQYLRESWPFLPQNRPFAEVSELQQVFGITPRQYALISPYLTVRGSGRVNLRAAERPVLLALPGLGEEAVAVIMRLRRRLSGAVTIDEVQQELSAGAREVLLEHLPALNARLVDRTHELEVVSEGWVDGGGVRRRVRALVVRAGQSTIVTGRRVE